MTGRLLFERLCRENGIPLGPLQADTLQRYVDMLLEWNRGVNLISRRDNGDIWITHILHSLVPWVRIVPPAGAAVLDLGTGGGLPGVPLAIVRGDLRITLLDSIRKKTVALDDMVGRLRLGSVSVTTGRAEDLSRSAAFARAFDLIVARAVAPLYKLARWSRPFLREGAAGWRPCLVAMKGGDLEEELRVARLRTPGWEFEVVPLQVRGAAELAGKLMVVARP
jgi:16S rRNA (guanine527-N7)-methyltransferase